MELKFGGIPLSDVVDCKSLAVSVESDLRDLDKCILTLNNLDTEKQKLGLEGMFSDMVKTAVRVPKEGARMASKAYKETNKQYLKSKDRWHKNIKPLIIKTLQEIGNILKNIYVKFMKLDKKYVELGKKIDYILKHKLNQVGALYKTTVNIHDLEPNVLKGYTEIMRDFKEYYESILSWYTSYIPPKDMVNAIKRGQDEKINKATSSLTELITKINEYGDVSVPWIVYKDKRYNKWFKDIINRKPSKDEMKMSLSEFVKLTIIGSENGVTIDVDKREKFISKMGQYLTLVASILNNKVIEKALSEGGSSIKKVTQDIYKEIEALSNAERPERKVEMNDKDSDEVQKDALGESIDSYISNSITLVTKLSTAYTGIVRGTLSAVFVIVGDTERIISIIDDSVGTKEER